MYFENSAYKFLVFNVSSAEWSPKQSRHRAKEESSSLQTDRVLQSSPALGAPAWCLVQAAFASGPTFVKPIKTDPTSGRSLEIVGCCHR